MIELCFAKYQRRKSFHRYTREQDSSHCCESNGIVKYKQAEPSFISSIYDSVTSSGKLEAEGGNASFSFFIRARMLSSPSLLLSEGPAVCGATIKVGD